MKQITVEVSEQVEATRAPWWMIVDPQQNFRTDHDGACAVAHMVTGPFFSRGEAQSFLDRTRYNFGKGAVVWCASGHQSPQWLKGWDHLHQSSREALKDIPEAFIDWFDQQGFKEEGSRAAMILAAYKAHCDGDCLPDSAEPCKHGHSWVVSDRGHDGEGNLTGQFRQCSRVGCAAMHQRDVVDGRCSLWYDVKTGQVVQDSTQDPDHDTGCATNAEPELAQQHGCTCLQYCQACERSTLDAGRTPIRCNAGRTLCQSTDCPDYSIYP